MLVARYTLRLTHLNEEVGAVRDACASNKNGVNALDSGFEAGRGFETCR